jgi:ABC-type antimicrobial peptide transport system permease subunit
MARTSFTLVMLCVAGAMALLLGIVGIYGVISYSVAQRTREIGIRMALGAQQANILSLVLHRAVVLVAIGLSLGGVFAWFAARFTAGYIYGVRAHDGVTFAAVSVVLAASSFFAAWLPARRAAAVDPILALRSE